jgi:hypothetical protein
MLPAPAEPVLTVDEGLLKVYCQYIQELWHNTSRLSFVSTAEGPELLQDDMTEALNMFSHHCPRTDMVAEIYCRAVTWEDINEMVSLRSVQDLIW